VFVAWYMQVLDDNNWAITFDFIANTIGGLTVAKKKVGYIFITLSHIPCSNSDRLHCIHIAFEV
jgi:hypothetical protein